MTDLENLREDLAAKTRALATAEAECGRLRGLHRDAVETGVAQATELIAERDTLRAQLAEAQKEIKGLRLVAFDIFERAERMGDRAECIAKLATEIQAKAADAKRIAGPIIDKVFDAAERAEQTLPAKVTT